MFKTMAWRSRNYFAFKNFKDICPQQIAKPQSTQNRDWSGWKGARQGHGYSEDIDTSSQALLGRLDNISRDLRDWHSPAASRTYLVLTGHFTRQQTTPLFLSALYIYQHRPYPGPWNKSQQIWKNWNHTECVLWPQFHKTSRQEQTAGKSLSMAKLSNTQGKSKFQTHTHTQRNFKIGRPG